MSYLMEFFKKETTKKLFVLFIIILFFYMMRGVLDLFLLTFLFTYITYKIQKGATLLLNKKFKKINQLVITIIIYTMLFFSLAFLIYRFIPIMITQCINIIDEISKFDLGTISGGLLGKYVVPAFKGVDLSNYSQSGINYLFQIAKNVGKWSFNVFVSLMLSMFFMLEKGKVKEFVHKFKSSKIGGLTKYISYFWYNFLNSFGKVMEAQLLIATVNSVLSVIALSFMHFPQLLGLGVMIFVLSLVPVAGTIISLIPLSIIAFNIGGIFKVISVLILIAVLHSLETYILNPKFMAAKTELPVFFIFIILILAEHFMGTWGLLIGVPLFMFILDLLGVTGENNEIT